MTTVKRVIAETFVVLLHEPDQANYAKAVAQRLQCLPLDFMLGLVVFYCVHDFIPSLLLLHGRS